MKRTWRSGYWSTNTLGQVSTICAVGDDARQLANALNALSPAHVEAMQRAFAYQSQNPNVADEDIHFMSEMLSALRIITGTAEGA